MRLRATCVDARHERDVILRDWRALSDILPRGRGLSACADWFWNNLDWLSPPEHRLRFVALRDGRSVVGLFPLETRRLVMAGIGVRCTGFIGGPYAVADTAILGDDDVDRLAGAFVSFLFDEMGGWWCFSTEGIDADSRIGRALIQAFSGRGMAVDRGSEERPYISFDGGWDGYLDSKSTNFRRNIRRAVRSLENMGRLDYRSGTASGPAALAVVDQLDAGSWRMAKEADVARNARLMAYCRNLYDTFPDPAAHVVRYLTVNDAPVASLYGFIHEGVFYAIKINYDASASHGSPGIVLLIRVFEELALQGITSIELLGRNEYLQRLGNASRRMSRLLLFNRSGRGLALGLAARTALQLRSLTTRTRKVAVQP